MSPLGSLRVRLVLWTVVLEALLLLVFALVLVVILRSTQNRQIEETLRLSATQLNAVVDLSDSGFRVSAAETADLRARGLLAWVLTPSGEVGLTVGEVDAHPLPAGLPPPEQITEAVLDNGAPVRLLVTPLQEGSRALGTIVVALPLAASQTFLNQILLSLAVAIPIVLVLSAAGGLFLANRALAPVATITATARQISAADLSKRLNLSLPNDEIGQLAQTFDAMLERLEAAFQRERQLTSDVSHELRTPLGMLKTQLSLARSRPRDAAALLQMMANIEGDVDRMTRLIEQLLTLARVEQKGLDESAPVDLGQLLTHVIDPLRETARVRQVSLNLSLPPQVNMHLQGDAEPLRQVFTNLIDNALKYTPAGGQVSVSAHRNWQEIAVSVSDTGTGIPPEHLPHLFERFYRVDSARARDTGGFGLGLAISQTIVQAHNGQITVDSQPDHGTTFTVTLPAGQPDSED
jgi:heavy metal sensor kinase